MNVSRARPDVVVGGGVVGVSCAYYLASAGARVVLTGGRADCRRMLGRERRTLGHEGNVPGAFDRKNRGGPGRRG